MDGTAVLVLKFSGNRLAICTCSITVMLTNDAVITGTKGNMKVPGSTACSKTSRSMHVNSTLMLAHINVNARVTLT